MSKNKVKKVKKFNMKEFENYVFLRIKNHIFVPLLPPIEYAKTQNVKTLYVLPQKRYFVYKPEIEDYVELGEFATLTWGSIVGNIIDQQDLTDYIYELNSPLSESLDETIHLLNILREDVNNIDPNAQENVIEHVQQNGVELPVNNKTVNILVPDIDLDNYYTKEVTEIQHDSMRQEIESSSYNTLLDAKGYTDDAISNLDLGEDNVIEVVQQNGVPLEIVDKAVNVIIPSVPIFYRHTINIVATTNLPDNQIQDEFTLRYDIISQRNTNYINAPTTTTLIPQIKSSITTTNDAVYAMNGYYTANVALIGERGVHTNGISFSSNGSMSLLGGSDSDATLNVTIAPTNIVSIISATERTEPIQ